MNESLLARQEPFHARERAQGSFPAGNNYLGTLRRRRRRRVMGPALRNPPSPFLCELNCRELSLPGDLAKRAAAAAAAADVGKLD